MENKLHTIDYKDWLLNQKRLPDKESEEYDAFFSFHKELCLNGFMMEGEFFNPFLYWHLNLWHTEVDVEDSFGRIQQKYANPWFRDNEWIITNEIWVAYQRIHELLFLRHETIPHKFLFSLSL